VRSSEVRSSEVRSSEVRSSEVRVKCPSVRCLHGAPRVRRLCRQEQRPPLCPSACQCRVPLFEFARLCAQRCLSASVECLCLCLRAAVPAVLP
jgi:hypothetical protein